MKINTILISLLEKITAFLFVGFFCVFFFLPVETGDIWWHLKAGQFIATHNYVPVIDPFPLVDEKSLWILTQWLGSLLYFIVHDHAGLFGLQLVRILLGLVILYVFIKHSSKRTSSVWVMSLSLILVLALIGRPHLRPFMFNHFFIQIFLISLLAYSSTFRFKSLVPIPLFGILWVNIHLGSFMYGLSLIGIFAFCSGVQFFKTKQSEEKNAADHKKLFFGYAGIFCLFSVCFLFNPYGLNGALHPLKTIFFEDYINFKHLGKTIGELQPPINLFSVSYLWFWPTLVCAFCAVYFDRINSFRNLILVVCSFFLFLYGRRAGVFFVLVSLYTFIDSLKSGNYDKYRVVPFLKVLLLLCFSGIFVFASLHRITQKEFVNGRGSSYFSVREANTSPLRILAFLNKHQIEGPIFNDDIYGGYLLWKAYPTIRPFSDTRQINLQANRLYAAILHDPERYWTQVDAMYRFRAVLLNANKLISRKAILFFMQREEWNLALVHGDHVLFLKRSAAAEEYVRSLRSEDAKIDSYRKALQFHLSEEVLYATNYKFIDKTATAITLFELGFRGAAYHQLLSSFEIANTPYVHEITKMLVNAPNR